MISAATFIATTGDLSRFESSPCRSTQYESCHHSSTAHPPSPRHQQKWSPEATPSRPRPLYQAATLVLTPPLKQLFRVHSMRSPNLGHTRTRLQRQLHNLQLFRNRPPPSTSDIDSSRIHEPILISAKAHPQEGPSNAYSAVSLSLPSICCRFDASIDSRIVSSPGPFDPFCQRIASPIRHQANKVNVAGLTPPNAGATS